MIGDNDNSLFTLSTSIRYDNINLFDGTNKLLILDFIPYGQNEHILTFSDNAFNITTDDENNIHV